MIIYCAYKKVTLIHVEIGTLVLLQSALLSSVEKYSLPALVQSLITLHISLIPALLLHVQQ